MASAPGSASIAGHVGVRKEQLLAIDLVVRDGRLPLVSGQPVDESLPCFGLHRRVPVRVHQDHAILVEQFRIALDDDRVVALVAEGNPGRPIGQDVGAHADTGVERGAHARSGFAVPSAGGGGEVDPGVLPEAQLGLVGAAVVAARGEGRLCGGDLVERGLGVFHAGDTGRIGGRADDDEVVVHHVEALRRRRRRRRISPRPAWRGRAARRRRRSRRS